MCCFLKLAVHRQRQVKVESDHHAHEDACAPIGRNAPTVRGDPTGLKCGMTHALQVTLITAEMTAGMLLVLGLIWVGLK